MTLSLVIGHRDDFSGGGGGGEGAFSDMGHPKDCEGDFDKIEPLKIFGSSTSSG